MIKKHEILTGVLTGILLATIGWAWRAEARFTLLEYNNSQILKEVSKADIERTELTSIFHKVNETLIELRMEIKHLKLGRKP